MVHLWQYFLEDNLDGLRQFLANATFSAGSQRGPSATSNHAGYKGSGVAVPSTSPRNSPIRSRKSADSSHTVARASGRQEQRSHQVNLTRADVNAKDAFGRTLLHHAASSSGPSAAEFVEALLQIPFIDLYVQDLESGWTPLHRALYHGHARIAQALMLKDMTDRTDYTTNVLHHVNGGLVKIKDREGNSPFELFTSTIAARDLQYTSLRVPTLRQNDTASVDSADVEDTDTVSRAPRRLVKSRVNLLGDEVFAFGSNKNLTLGLGDEDDRQFPEQVALSRPEPLLYRLHVDAQARRLKERGTEDLGSGHYSTQSAGALPAVVANQPILIQNVVMSKLHTVVITNDPESNVHVCGFGPGGRLGTGDESTRFSFVCLQTGGISKKHVVDVAVGQDHSIAICEQGEVYTWGSNRYGQLGYSLPESSSAAKDNPMQLTPRQLFGPMKKEMIIGAAASSLHSVIFTVSALYAFGKNEGQLGLMDADARSLETQSVPRRVGVSVLQSPIVMVSAIDRATTILLESHEVVVLTHYGWTKVAFQLEGFTSFFLNSHSATRYDHHGNYISKITSGGNTVCALSAFGEVFTVNVSNRPDRSMSSQSTTNPSKARNALPPPSKLWSIGKAQMAATDVAVGQDGSIILCTASGTIWRKEKRAKIKEANADSTSRMKDYKFTRIPNINRAVGVRSNAYGAYTAIRKDCDVTRSQIIVDPPSIWETLFSMLPFRELALDDEDSETEHPRPRFWTSSTTSASPARVKQAVLQSTDVEMLVGELMKKYHPLEGSQFDMWITSSASDIMIPAHCFLVKARSPVLRHALAEFQTSYYFSIPGVLAIEYDSEGHIQLRFQSADLLTILSFVFYLYTDQLIDVWHHTQRRLHMAPRYRQVRTELIKIGSNLDMSNLERAARVMEEPAKCVHLDMESAFRDPEFFSDTDVVIEIARGSEMTAHSALLSRRCPFFAGLFSGRAGGLWLSSRRAMAGVKSEIVPVDLKHVEQNVLEMVLRHIYAETGEELFDNVETADLDAFIDLIIEVMALSNELMLERLTQICQKMLGQYVTTRNVCQLLNAVAPCSVEEFKHAALEYVCLNLETMLEHRLLEELDPDLLIELDDTIRDNQLACFPFARSGRAEAELLDHHPELAAKMEQEKQRTIDALRLRPKVLESEERVRSTAKTTLEGTDGGPITPYSATTKRPTTAAGRDAKMPVLTNPRAGSEMFFEMEEDVSVGESIAHAELVKHAEDESSGRGVSSSYHGVVVPSDQEVPNAGSTGPSSYKRVNQTPEQAQACHPSIDASSEGGIGTGQVWQNAPTGSVRMGLKDIMAQTSASRTSNLTLAISQRDAQLAKAPQRPSQRERKKMQHLRIQDDVSGPAEESQKQAASPVSAHDPPSPWQAAAKRPSLARVQDKTLAVSDTPQSSPRPAMTMRQTVAGASSAPKSHTPTKVAAQSRSVSSPGVGPSSQAKPHIQSIRHTSVASTVSGSPSAASHSMADILAQQLGEKTAVKEAAASRSLSEIQREQEFQEWWDSESKRVQEEEQASTAAATKGRQGGGRGRGRGGRRKGSGRGGGGPGPGSPSGGSLTGPLASSRGSGRASNRGDRRESEVR